MILKRISLVGLLIFSLSVSGYAERELLVAQSEMKADAPGLRLGQEAPDFAAVSAEGEMIELSELRGKGPVVLIFYRGAWCPYCDLHLRSFQKRIDEFKQLDASIVAISVDKAEFSRQIVEKGGLEFDVLSNPDAKILEAYGLRFYVPAELATKYRDQYGIDLVKHSGREDFLIAVPATYVVGQDGVIKFAYADLDYKIRATPEQVLEIVGELK